MACIVRIHEYGDPSVLRIEDIEVPPPASGEVQIEVKSIGVAQALNREFCVQKPVICPKT